MEGSLLSLLYLNDIQYEIIFKLNFSSSHDVMLVEMDLLGGGLLNMFTIYFIYY